MNHDIMQQHGGLSHSLKGMWTLMVLAPLLTLLDRGAGVRFIVSGTLYISGWVLLWTALRRDRRATELKLFWQSTLARVAGTGVVLMLVILGFFGMSVDGLLNLATALLAGFFALWTLRPTAEALTKSVENILLMGSSIAVALLIGEIMFRIPPVVARTGGNTPGMDRWSRTQYDEIATAIIKGVTKGNPLALRSLHLEKSKPHGVFRVLALGDSFTWGDKIARTEDTWPFVVEQILRQKGYRLEVINMGHAGFTTANEAELLDRIGWSFEPDLILVQYNLNDPLPSGPNYFRETESWLFQTRPLSPVFDEPLDQHSYLYSFLNAQVRSLQIRWKHPDGYAPLYVDNFVGWRQCLAALRQMGEQARRRGVPILLAMFPSFVPEKMDDSSYPYLDIHRKVSIAAQEAGLRVLDLRPVYAQFGLPGNSWWALPSDMHPNVKAQRVAGQAIVKTIEELRFIAQGKPQ